MRHLAPRRSSTVVRRCGMSSVWPPMVTRTTTSPDVHATEPAAEMFCGERVHDSASDWVRSRSICSRIAACPVRASSTPVPSKNTFGSSAKSAMAPSTSLLDAVSTIRESTCITSASVRGSAFMSFETIPAKGGPPWEAESRPKTAPSQGRTKSGRPGSPATSSLKRGRPGKTMIPGTRTARRLPRQPLDVPRERLFGTAELGCPMARNQVVEVEREQALEVTAHAPARRRHRLQPDRPDHARGEEPHRVHDELPERGDQGIVVVVLHAVAGHEQPMLRQADDALGSRGLLEDHDPRAGDRERSLLGDLPAEARLGVRLLSGHTPELYAEPVDVVAIVATMEGTQPHGVLERSFRQQLGLGASLSRTGLSSTQPSGTRTATMFRLNVIFSPSGIDIAFALDASQTSGKHSRNGRWCEAGG